MVRALLHFSDLAKETEKLDEHHYLLTLYYDKSDEAEMVFRVLSFGPTVYVLEPKYFRKLIQSRLQEQFFVQWKKLNVRLLSVIKRTSKRHTIGICLPMVAFSRGSFFSI